MNMAKEKYETPYSRAREKFMQSEDYKKMTDLETLTQRQFLKNRIELAFEAGWNARGDLKK